MAAPVSLRYRLIVGIILLAAFVFFWGIRGFELRTNASFVSSALVPS
jgi:hypothetical protein